MRHQKKTVKLGRKEGHRKSLLANLAVSLIEHNRIKTTLAKAKAMRPLAEKLVTIGKKNTLHARRTAKAVLRQDDADRATRMRATALTTQGSSPDAAAKAVALSKKTGMPTDMVERNLPAAPAHQ